MRLSLLVIGSDKRSISAVATSVRMTRTSIVHLVVLVRLGFSSFSFVVAMVQWEAILSIPSFALFLCAGLQIRARRLRSDGHAHAWDDQHCARGALWTSSRHRPKPGGRVVGGRTLRVAEGAIIGRVVFSHDPAC